MWSHGRVVYQASSRPEVLKRVLNNRSGNHVYVAIALWVLALHQSATFDRPTPRLVQPKMKLYPSIKSLQQSVSCIW